MNRIYTYIHIKHTHAHKTHTRTHTRTLTKAKFNICSRQNIHIPIYSQSRNKRPPSPVRIIVSVYFWLLLYKQIRERVFIDILCFQGNKKGKTHTSFFVTPYKNTISTKKWHSRIHAYIPCGHTTLLTLRLCG